MRVQGALMSFEVDIARIGSFLLLGTKNTGAGKFADKNVVSDREKVADAQDQDATETRLKRFAQNLEQLLLIVSAKSELCSVFQQY